MLVDVLYFLWQPFLRAEQGRGQQAGAGSSSLHHNCEGFAAISFRFSGIRVSFHLKQASDF